MVNLSSQAWSSCGESRAFNPDVSNPITNAGKGSGLLTVDSVDSEVTHTYGVSWCRCGEAPTQDFASTGYASIAGWKDVIAKNSQARTFTGDFTTDGKTDVLFTLPDETWWVGTSDGTRFTFKP
jgi:hypothetical protein